MITRFNIGKEKKYNGLKIQIGWFKFERIWFKNLFLLRFEITNWK